MNFQDFKDQVMLTLYEKKVKETIAGSGPVYMFGKTDGAFIAGCFGSIDTFSDIPDNMRKLIHTQGFEYAALCSAAMIGKIKHDEDEKLMRKLEGLSNDELHEFLKDNDLLQQSIAVRIESKYSDDDTCIVNIALTKTLEFKDIEEIPEDGNSKMSTQDGEENPFGDGFFN